MSADMLRGVAIGSLVLTGFGALWLVLGIRFLFGFDWRVLFCVAVIAAVLVLGALRMWGAAAHVSSGVAAGGETFAGPAFGIVSTVEFGLILITVLVCRLAHRGELILPIIALIVGLHFIPLAAIFGVRMYYVTAVAIVLAVLASFFAPSERLRQAIASLACGSVLWVTSAFLLLRASLWHGVTDSRSQSARRAFGRPGWSAPFERTPAGKALTGFLRLDKGLVNMIFSHVTKACD